MVIKHLDKAANLAVILGVAVFIAITARNEFRPHIQVNKPPSHKELLGTTLPLTDLSYPLSRTSLVLVVSTSCHYCQESLPYYRDLPSHLKGKVDLVAVLPQAVPEAQTYLQNAQVHVNKIISANLDKIGIDGTPTILLLDSQGKVKKLWVGLLDKKQQDDVISNSLQQS